MEVIARSRKGVGPNAPLVTAVALTWTVERMFEEWRW
jgi:hypothetical protein